jgi:hypothetical protein
MNFEPQKFFIGLVDFFSIFMPGTLLTYLVKDWAAMKFLGTAGYALNGPEPVIVFFFASYLLGHAAFLLSAVLDEWIYDPIRALTDWGQSSALQTAKTCRRFGCGGWQHQTSCSAGKPTTRR